MMHYAACSPALPRVARRTGTQPAWLHSFVSHRHPPAFPRRAGDLSGRPFCRVYLDKQLWVLELEPASGAWLEPAHENGRMGHAQGPTRLTFATLAAAIGYAERRGLDYRVIPPAPQRRVHVPANDRMRPELPLKH